MVTLEEMAWEPLYFSLQEAAGSQILKRLKIGDWDFDIYTIVIMQFILV